MFKVNIPEILRSRNVFGTLYVKFITKIGDSEGKTNAVEMLFPDDANKSICNIEFSMNGIDLPQEMFEDIFFKYAEYYAKQAVRDEVTKRFEVLEDGFMNTAQMINDLQDKICKDFGLEIEDYR